MAEFCCGKCAVCKPEPCRKCPACKGRHPARCDVVKDARSKQCLNSAALKAEHDAAEAKEGTRENRRANLTRKRAQAAAAPAPAKDPVRVAAALKAAATRQQQKASGPVDGRGSISWNDHEVDVEAVDAALAAKLINAGADATAWPKPAVRERPAGRGGAATRPELDAGWDGAFGPDVEVPDEAHLVQWLHDRAWWWKLPHNLDDKAVREHVVENLELCKKHNVRPFQHGWLLSPATYRTLLGKYVSAAARRDFYNFSSKCRRGAAESFAEKRLVVPDRCELCARIAGRGTEIAGALRDFRAAFAAKHGDGDDDDDDEADLAGEEEEDAAGPIFEKTVQTAGGPIVAISAKSASGAFDPARRSVMKCTHRLFAHSASCSTISSTRRYFATGSATGATSTSSPPSTNSPTHKSSPTTSASATWPRPSPAASGPARRRRRRTVTTSSMLRASPSPRRMTDRDALGYDDKRP